MFDWNITVSSDGRSSILYRADGRYISPEQLPEKENFKSLFYYFPEEILDPDNFSDEQKEHLAQFGSTENRSNGPVTSPALFNALYDTSSRMATERHTMSISFLGQHLNVHKKIAGLLSGVDKEIRTAALTDKAVAGFIKSLGSAGGYVWRTVRDTPGRSMHSLGLAVDLLPRNMKNGAIYWYWEKQKSPGSWMTVPVSRRWKPPEQVIDIFEKAGFIWGGKWGLWDNMHFEYRPELIAWRAYSQPVISTEIIIEFPE